jgi:hypothetical protein
MMTVLVIGFNAATRTEQMAARNYSYQEQANQMAMLGVNQAVAMLNTNLTNWSARTQPGRVMTTENGPLPLTSESVPGASGPTNVNAWADSNFWIAPTTNPAAFAVPVVEVRRGTNRIGGYAFWVDDDGSRLNLNAASTTARTNFLPTNARPLVLNRDLFPAITANFWTGISNGFNALVNSNPTTSTNGWSYFFTPRQIVSISNIGTANYNTMMFQIGAGPLNWRPTNSYALGSNGVPAVLNAPGDFLATYGGANYSGSLSSLSNALSAAAGKFFRGQNYNTYFGDADGFAAKYGSNTLNQIIANINDAVLPGGSAGNAFTGANSVDMLGAAYSGDTNSFFPSSVLGLRPALFLNEVAFGVAYNTNGLDGNPELQIWMQCEVVDPYGTGQGATYEIQYGLRSLGYSGSFRLGTATIGFTNIPAATEVRYGAVPGVGAVPSGTFHVPSRAYVFDWQFATNGTIPPMPPNASNVVISNMTVQPAFVALRATAGAPETIRDWAIFADFPTNGFVFTNVPIGPLVGFGSSGPVAAPNSRFSQSIEKNDPRVRTYGTNSAATNAPAWRFVSSQTLGANNSSVNFNAGTGIQGLANDAPGAAATIYQHPSFAGGGPIYTLGRSNWISAFDLSRIHTGLQWRTLQFRAQAQDESGADYVPDWALLEAFTVTNSAPSAARSFKLNINAQPYPAGTGLNRTAPIGSLLAGMTAANAPTAAVGTNNLGFPATAGFATPAAAMLVGSNVANLAFTNTWSSRREGNNNYQAGLYTLPAEVLEVNGVSNFSTDEAANEARAQGVYSGVTVASQVFTVFSAGFANDKQGTEVAQARVRAQVARDPTNNLFRVIFLEPLIWP